MNSVEKPALRADARRNRARVLAAAEAAFAASGTTVPLDEIARRAGVGAGTVYRHFPSKEALFEAVVLERIEQLAQQARAKLAEQGDPGPAFFEFFAVVAEQATLNKALCDALEASTGLGFKAEQGVDNDFRAAFGELLTRAQRAGAVRADIEVADVRALLAGYLAMERGSAPGRHLGRILTDGLRPTS
ncbi:TetR/AcrR family transcriptional regulator [Amycolatopsis nigrescens]|uniref:TetR/AcrR family transcriptional regulator n=1 Tax=Amycolatopsis nigrescens TaxID=381445 RepID=UPI00037CF6EE|nr:TetR/AcrR family transcriptional regulator [Amycolatopsis nigrescens]